MKANIDVKDRREADAIRTALNDPVIHASVVITGVLLQLPTKRARKRVLDFVIDKLGEEEEAAVLVTASDGGQS